MFWYSYGREWHDLTGTCAILVRWIQISAPVDRRKKQSNTSSLTAHYRRLIEIAYQNKQELREEVVIDALDECDRDEYIWMILLLLAEA